jgi:hypothetical protein
MTKTSLVALLLSVSACTTPYAPMGPFGGYVDTEVAPGVHEIVVRGNGVTSIKTLEGYFHRRARELCDEERLPFYDFRLNASAERSPSSFTATPGWGGRVTVTESRGISRGVLVGVIQCMETNPGAR